MKLFINFSLRRHEKLPFVDAELIDVISFLPYLILDVRQILRPFFNVLLIKGANLDVTPRPAMNGRLHLTWFERHDPEDK